MPGLWPFLSTTELRTMTSHYVIWSSSLWHIWPTASKTFEKSTLSGLNVMKMRIPCLENWYMDATSKSTQTQRLVAEDWFQVADIAATTTTSTPPVDHLNKVDLMYVCHFFFVSVIRQNQLLHCLISLSSHIVDKQHAGLADCAANYFGCGHVHARHLDLWL